MENEAGAYKYFLTYSGVKLPLNLVSPLDADALGNRNTYIRASYDAANRLVRCEKLVYGEVELRHDYEYGAQGNLSRASINMSDEETVIVFDADGQPIRD